MENIIGKYIGPNKVTEAKVSGRKTYSGKEVVEVTYEDESREEFPQEILPKIVTDEKSDLTTLRDNFVKPIVEKIIAVLLDAEIKIIDIEYVLTHVSTSLNFHLEKSNEILWGKDLLKRTLADIQKILTKKEKQKEFQEMYKIMKCKECGFQASSRKELRQHWKDNHKIKNKTKTLTQKNDPGTKNSAKTENAKPQSGSGTCIRQKGEGNKR